MTRKIAHTIYSTAVKEEEWQNEYDWMPLAGDPSKKQREKLIQKSREQEIKEAIRKQEKFLQSVQSGAKT